MLFTVQYRQLRHCFVRKMFSQMQGTFHFLQRTVAFVLQIGILNFVPVKNKKKTIECLIKDIFSNSFVFQGSHFLDRLSCVPGWPLIHSVIEAVLKLLTLLSSPPKSWGYRHELLCLALTNLFAIFTCILGYLGSC